MATLVDFPDKHYVPILKGKDGEHGAVKELRQRARALTTPLFELAPSDGALEDVVDRFIRRIGGWQERFFVDDLRVPASARTSAGETAMARVLAGAESGRLPAVPVTGIDRGTAHHATLQNYAAATGSGVALRLTFAQVRSASFANDVNATMAALQLTPPAIDLILDLGPVDPGLADVLGVAVGGVINGLPQLHDWRTVTVASS